MICLAPRISPLSAYSCYLKTSPGFSITVRQDHLSSSCPQHYQLPSDIMTWSHGGIFSPVYLARLTRSVRVMKATLEQINQRREVKFLPQQLCELSGKRVQSFYGERDRLLRISTQLKDPSTFNKFRFCLRIVYLQISHR